jgi:hypothetical protein
MWGRCHVTKGLSLLTGLIAVFLVVMGVVSTVVLGRLEQGEFNSSLQLVVRQSAAQITKGPDGFAAAYLSVRTGAYGELTPDSAAGGELRQFLGTLAGKSRTQVLASLKARGTSGRPFDLSLPGSPTLRAAWRSVDATAVTTSILPPGANVILVGQSATDIASHVRGLVISRADHRRCAAGHPRRVRQLADRPRPRPAGHHGQQGGPDHQQRRPRRAHARSG